MLEASARGCLKMAAGYESERTGDGALPGLGLGLMTSEVNRKRKSSGHLSKVWNRSTRFVSSGLLVSFS